VGRGGRWGDWLCGDIGCARGGVGGEWDDLGGFAGGPVPGAAHDSCYEGEELAEGLAVLRVGGRFGTGDGQGEDLEELRVGHDSALAQNEGAEEGAEVVAEGAGLAQAVGDGGEVGG
jgi:hypothetical protein